MNVRLVKVRRRPPWPWWAVLLVAVWVAAGCATIHASRKQGRPIAICLFKRVTGLPCPTCGTTRAAEHLLHGRVGSAAATQPFMFCAAVAFATVTALRVAFARQIRLGLSSRGRKIAGALLAGAFAANWVYVIGVVG